MLLPDLDADRNGKEPIRLQGGDRQQAGGTAGKWRERLGAARGTFEGFTRLDGREWRSHSERRCLRGQHTWQLRFVHLLFYFFVLFP